METDKTTILVIDDNQEFLYMITILLQRLGFSVIGSLSGEDGLAKASEHNPDLIVTDLMMPGISGIEVAMRLRGSSNLRHIPIFLLTAYGTQSIDFSLFSKVLTKPVGKELGSHIREFLALNV